MFPKSGINIYSKLNRHEILHLYAIYFDNMITYEAGLFKFFQAIDRARVDDKIVAY